LFHESFFGRCNLLDRLSGVLAVAGRTDASTARPTPVGNGGHELRRLLLVRDIRKEWLGGCAELA
jgi:hypothetical protein